MLPKIGRPALPDNQKRKSRSIKLKDDVYQKLHELGKGSYSKGVEFLVYNYTELKEESRSDESRSKESNGKAGG